MGRESIGGPRGLYSYSHRSYSLDEDQVVMEVDSEEYEEEGSDVESPLPSPLPSAGSIDLISGNANFVALE
jgi:hypothetical protein